MPVVAIIMLVVFAAHVVVAFARADQSHGPLIRDQNGE